MTVGLDEQTGSAGDDRFDSRSETIQFGLQGADLFREGDRDDIAFSVGGSGDDRYVMAGRNSFAWIYDGGIGDNDSLVANGISLNSPATFVATIEGRHLWIGNSARDKDIWVLDWDTETGRIETFELGGRTYGYSAMVTAVANHRNNLGDISLEDHLDRDEASAVRHIISYAQRRAATLEGNTPSDQRDVLVGSMSNDQIDGRAGDDTLYGNRGRDVLSGGDGDDTLYGGISDTQGNQLFGG